MICPHCKKSIFTNEYRRKIFDICKEPKSFTELKKLVNLSSGALTHHLKVLEEEKLIKKHYKTEDGKFMAGKEISIKSYEDLF